MVVAEASVAKTSLYRYFKTKDDLIVAFLQRARMSISGSQWDRVAAKHAEAPEAEFEAHLRWIGERLARSNYRGCPQINVAAEFAEANHPARQVALEHMRQLRLRLKHLAVRLGAARPNELAAQLAPAGQRCLREFRTAYAQRGPARLAGLWPRADCVVKITDGQ